MSVSGEGADTPAPVGVAFRAVEHRSGAVLRPEQFFPAPQKAACQQVYWKAHTKGCPGRIHCPPSCEPVSALQ